MQLERSNIIEDNRFRVSELTEANLGLLFGRINNAFVERFETDFKCDSEGVRFLRYLRDRSAELKRLIKVLDVENTVDSDPVAYDYALVDFVACSLKPQQLHGLMCDTEHTTQATLFDHVSMRSALSHLELCLSVKAKNEACRTPHFD